MLSEIVDAIDLQLTVLGSFGELYHREVLENGSMTRYAFYWHKNLRSRIRDAIKEVESQATGGHSQVTRSPVQH